jgi:hypothetical protein
VIMAFIDPHTPGNEDTSFRNLHRGPSRAKTLGLAGSSEGPERSLLIFRAAMDVR